ncbi:hypothetical protein KCP73_19080 [Salmonella enterica subsp. enterica]|nr:hypothetical protein KCP73_19080 [Salmonella enterica subsp. enterica]
MSLAEVYSAEAGDKSQCLSSDNISGGSLAVKLLRVTRRVGHAGRTCNQGVGFGLPPPPERRRRSTGVRLNGSDFIIIDRRLMVCRGRRSGFYGVNFIASRIENKFSGFYVVLLPMMFSVLKMGFSNRTAVLTSREYSPVRGEVLFQTVDAFTFDHVDGKCDFDDVA